MRIEIEDVTVALGGHEVVRGVSLEVPTGTVLGLVGPNGSGKSSLLRTLYRAVVPREGAVRVGGRDVRAMRGRESARTLAVMLQDAPAEFDLSVEETVMLGRGPHHPTFGRDTAEDLEVVAAAMARTGIADLADRMIATLSGGQRQRVMLARALAQQAPVLVLDEPSNHLDISHQHELMSTVRDLGGTTLAALHDLTLAAQYCDRVAVLEQGRLVAVGPPAEVLTPALIRRTFHVHARVLTGSPHPVFAFRRAGAEDPSAAEATPTPTPTDTTTPTAPMSLPTPTTPTAPTAPSTERESSPHR
ncbi:ABC transporter ATP-binding protein [Brachybacterium saurashtrense]|uniref:ABC transporter ATP-binding protein n=1 Tax=Brachybacterium saurashtrense TaxID=556288 RepID=A0A345YQD4_9MICO|nr:ABC transporter ATP-binding protein [Brachybacterium saurashtrense]AXK46136.1 ABC transporter ATP-binding protein [Brachybacterium saurashtrense]RRR23876.1 ABC transporter ATP-binding protein [Brachybacterium saurashtrense]